MKTVIQDFSDQCNKQLIVPFLPDMHPLIICLGCTVPLEVKVAEDHGKQKAAFYAGFSVSQQEVEVNIQLGLQEYEDGR